MKEMQYARQVDLKFLEANYIPSNLVPDYRCRESNKQRKGGPTFLKKIMIKKQV